ncbi:AfsR/SARP family transcriptional regulator [Streptomyces canus]|uniref:AfsR/SARP family transcriptional regulator n=1 Tax=Streptomyces canus TaxID=58343 RepID=UPI002250409E|nr:AfsR/SARP family transcriptional regulator [Streptomyces canus]MCX4856303.1 AfsR/SARP family transcriptional regulator [Streptomyces canus]
MDIGLLGPLQAQTNGHTFVPTAAKPRQILALLALGAGRMVTVSTLMTELWDDAPPPSAATTVQTYVLQIRKGLDAALGEPGAAKNVLVTRHGGYSLDVPLDHVDVHCFERLAGAGRAAAEQGDSETVSRVLANALGMWRGVPLSDVRAGPILRREVVRLNEMRLSLLDARIETDLARGRHGDLLGELTMLTAAYPLNENLWAHFLTALHRTGHRWRALEAYRRLRDIMVEELGLEPSSRLRRLHQAILSGDGPEQRTDLVDGPQTTAVRRGKPIAAR